MKYLVHYEHEEDGKRCFDWGWADSLAELEKMISRLTRATIKIKFYNICEIENMRNIMFSQNGTINYDNLKTES